MELHELKKKVHEVCMTLIQSRVDALNQELKGFQAAANEESKSSAGDKYETGRAMMHLEKEKVASQLNQVLKQQKVLRELHSERKSEEAELGSLLSTDQGLFYISISLGLIQTPEAVFGISPVAPLGTAFLGKKTGDVVSFNGKSYKINGVA
ncbi:3-oxoacyl-ACP synthase [Marinoscillum sp.]|uniref:3-oxoacyl-ACP synthase n=1 Tax=Marinoscillum sp. TaxID=2024838 RepID=UPI003BAAB443